MRAVTGALCVAALIIVPLSAASGSPSAHIYADTGTAESLDASTTVTSAPDSLVLTTQMASQTASTVYGWQVSLGPTEALTQLSDGSVAVVAPWPADVTAPGDGTDYTSPAGAPGPKDGSDPPPLSESDPYALSADPDGSMAADEALHDVGPFEPAYPDEYVPDTGSDDPSDPDSPANANTGPPPGADTADTTSPSDDEIVPEADRLDALYQAEASRSDQIVALISSPQATDAIGQPVPASLSISAPDTIDVQFGPSLSAAYPFTATSSVTFNPDAETTVLDQTPADSLSLPRCTNVARDLVYTEQGNRPIVNALARRPGQHICHYIALEPSKGSDGNYTVWPTGRVAFVHGKNKQRVAAAGSKFVAVARIDWLGGIGSGDPYVIGTQIRRNMYDAGFRAGSPNQDTWVINEVPSDIFTSSARRSRLIRLVQGLYYGPRGFRRMPGFVFKVWAEHDSAARFLGFATYKSNWKSLLVRTDFWLPDQPSTPTNARSIAPYVRWWAEETYSYCSLLCVRGAQFDGTTQPPGNTKVHKSNEYLQHPARLAFARPSPPPPAPPLPEGEARRLFDHGYMSVINSAWPDLTHDGVWQTAYLSQPTMLRFVSLQLYAARRWAADHPYPDRNISLVWKNGLRTPNEEKVLAGRLADAVADGYGNGGTALDVCPGHRKATCNASMTGAEESHYGPAHFIPSWQTYFSSW